MSKIKKINPFRVTTHLATATFMFIFLVPTSYAFDYLEHSYFTDRACLTAQKVMGHELTRASLKSPQHLPPQDLAIRYVTLALFCPQKWNRRYCQNNYKQAEGTINELLAPPWISHDHAITLGDYAALPDHLSQFGSIPTIPHAQEAGLTDETLRWLIPQFGHPGGVIADVAEDGCETDQLVEWPNLNYTAIAPNPFFQDDRQLQPIYRIPPLQGPHDSPGLYSFDNPHYLDLILNNQAHFGKNAFDNWLGFHSTATSILSQPCQQLLSPPNEAIESLANHDNLFANIDWDSLPFSKRRDKMCQVLENRIVQRINYWSTHASPHLVKPAKSFIAWLNRDSNLRRHLVPTFLSLIFEGSGLHFLQDAFAGGHQRTPRGSLGLSLARYFHDTDNQYGVIARYQTMATSQLFVAFGDGFLLGKSTCPPNTACQCQTFKNASKGAVTHCLLQRQRKILTNSTAASLIDWSLNNSYPQQNPPCQTTPRLSFICQYLPTRSPTVISPSINSPILSLTLPPGTLPIPPPPFSYESLSFGLSFDLEQKNIQSGLRLVFLSALGAKAHWMSSYHFGFLHTTRNTGGNDLIGEFAYMFHWRWAARFLINMGPLVFTNYRNTPANSGFLLGVGPNLGLSLLPEGWTKIPLEITFSYRLPMALIDSRQTSPIHFSLEGHWLELNLGFAFL